MTSLTLVTVLIVLLGIWSRRGYGVALALGGVTAAGAALFLGGVAIPTFYAVAIGAAAKLALDLLQRESAPSPLPPGVSLLLALLGWGVLVTCVAPFLFSGLVTVTPAHNALLPGVLTTSNIAQIIYLVLGICVVVTIARDRRAGVGLLGITVGGAVLLSLWRYGADFGVPFPVGFFDNSPTLQYIETAAGGIVRFRGTFSEPSALAGTCVIMVAYGVSRAWQVRGLRRIGVLAIVGIAIYLGVVSTSTTFLVAGVAIVVIAGITFLFGFLSRVTRVGALLSIAACLLIVLGMWLLPVAADFVQAAVQQKVSGASYSERSGADNDSYATFIDTWGFGVGLGAGRASSLLPTVLSTTGLVGGLLLVATVVGLVFRTAPLKAVRPAIWALVASLTAKAIAGPDLADPSGVFWISLGVMSGAAMRAAFPPVGLAVSGQERLRFTTIPPALSSGGRRR